MADNDPVLLRVTHRRADHVVASLRGDLTSITAPDVLKSLTKLLLGHGQVLLDVEQARLVWPPAPELFTTAIATAGGWPSARLVLIGATRHTTDRLHACRVTESVPLARTEAEAAELVAQRPVRLLRSTRFPAHPSSVNRAAGFVEDVGRAWEMTDPDGRAVSIVRELAANAIRHTRVEFRVVLVLVSGTLRISVRRYQRAISSSVDLAAAAAAPEEDLGSITELSDTWGVLRYDDGMSVWAVLQVADPAGIATIPSAAGARVHPRRTRPAQSSRARATRPPPDRPAPADPAAAVERRHILTYDPEQAHEILSAVYSRHTVWLTGDHDRFRFEHSAVRTRDFALERIAHGVTGRGHFEPWADIFVVAHRGGRCRVTAGQTALDATRGDVTLMGAEADHELCWSDMDSEAVRLDAAEVAEVAAEVCGIDADAVRFDLSHPISAQRGRHWLSLVRSLNNGVLDDDVVLASPLTRATIFRHLVTTLVETFPNPALDALHARRPGPGWVEPAVVRRAAQYIDEHAGDDIGLGDIARAARVGPRALQLAFRRHRDVTPLEHLRRVRLERVHRDLVVADATAGDTVAMIATRWGFAHHGYFASSYRRVYGHSPNVTLRS
jgi:AraC-like DNA-binding protein